MNAEKGLVIVTGCCGRIGSFVTERFGKEGFDVVGFDIVEPKQKPSYLDFMQVDVSSDISVEQAFSQIRQKYGERITSIIHLAAYYSFSKGSPEKYEQITVRGTGRMLKGAKQFHCEQFLFSGTQLIYLPCDVDKKINESSPIHAKWDYPESKIETEELIRSEHGNIPSVVLRIAGCYDNECHSIPISNQIQRIYEKQLIAHLFSGNISHGSPYLHLEDLTEAIWLSVQNRHRLPKETALLIGEGKTMSYDAMQREISRLLFDKEMTTYRVPKWFAKIGAWILDHTPFVNDFFIQPWMIDISDDNYTLDISKAKELLGWEPKNYIKDTLPKMIDFLKRSPIEFYKTNDLH